MEKEKIFLHDVTCKKTWCEILDANEPLNSELTGWFEEDADDFAIDFLRKYRPYFKENSGMNTESKYVIEIDERYILNLFELLDSENGYPVENMSESGVFDELTLVEDAIKEMKSLSCSPKRYKHLRKECIHYLNIIFNSISEFFYDMRKPHLEDLTDMFMNRYAPYMDENYDMVFYYFKDASTLQVYYDKKVVTPFTKESTLNE